MEFGILGSLEVSLDGRDVLVGGPKPRALLGLLLVHAGEVVSAERLVEELWEDDPPRSAAATLQTYVSQLRRVLGADVVETAAGGYRLRVPREAVDATRFEDALRSIDAETLSAAERASRLGEALGSWRGVALADFAGAHWAVGEAARLEGMRQAAIEERAEARLELGEHVRLVGELEQLVGQYPLRERLWAQLMLALYRSDRQADALRAYQRLREHLGDELGIEPSRELVELEQAILLHDTALDLTPDTSPGPAMPTVALPSGVVTFLLTDVVGSSQLWEEAPAAMGDALVAHELLIADAVGAHRGFLLKARGEGDSTFSVFQRATDALAAAIAAQDTLRAHVWPGAIDFAVRMAVHTGETLERDGDYFGATVNRAARLRELSQAGDVLFSQASAQLILDHLPDNKQLTALGSYELRGLRRGEHVYRLLDEDDDARDEASDERDTREVPASLPVPLAVAASAPLTGRDDDLAELRAAWARGCGPSVSQPRQVVTVSGEPGIGKTRLVAELAATVVADGGRVYYGRCDENASAPFLPWEAVLDALVSEVSIEVLKELRDDAAELQRLCPQLAIRLELPPATVGDLEGERTRLLAAVERIVIAASERAPFLIVVDDLHWADRSSLVLFARLAAIDVSGRFLLVGTYRNTELERSHPLSTTLAELRRTRRSQRLNLRCLDSHATASLIALRAGHEPDTALAGAIFAETDGHPFFVEEICTYLTEMGIAQVLDDSLTISEDLRDIGIPEGVRDVLGRRFDRLSPDALEALRVGAVYGPVFDVLVLEELLTDRAVVLDGIEEACRAGLVRERTDEFGTYEFCHALVRNTLVDEISSVRRTRLHREIALTIERVHADPTPADVDLLAFHFGQAAADGDIAKAIEYGCRAAEQAITTSAYDEADAYLERGFEIVAHARSDSRAAKSALLIKRSELLWRTRAATKPAAQAAAREAAALAREANAPGLFADAVCTLAISASGRIDRDILSLIEEAIERLGQTHPARSVHLQAVRLFHRSFGGDLDGDADDESRALIDAARATGDSDALIWALTGANAAFRGRPSLPERRAIAEEGVALTQGRDLLLRGGAYQALSEVELTAGDRLGFLRALDEYGRIVDEVGTIAGSAWNLIGRITDALVTGQFAEADERIRQYTAPGGDDDSDALLSQLLWLRAEQGRLLEIERLLATFESVVHLYPVVVPMLAFAYARLGRLDPARAMLQAAAEDDFAILRRDFSWPVALGLLTEASMILDDLRFRAQLHRELAPYRGQLLAMIEVLCIGAADRYLGMLDHAAGRTDEALSGFRAALEVEARYPAPPLMARTQYWHSLALATDPARHAEARSLLNECVGTATALGMTDLANQARERIDERST